MERKFGIHFGNPKFEHVFVPKYSDFFNCSKFHFLFLKMTYFTACIACVCMYLYVYMIYVHVCACIVCTCICKICKSDFQSGKSFPVFWPKSIANIFSQVVLVCMYMYVYVCVYFLQVVPCMHVYVFVCILCMCLYCMNLVCIAWTRACVELLRQQTQSRLEKLHYAMAPWAGVGAQSQYPARNELSPS